jgi:hypothetical protein
MTPTPISESMPTADDRDLQGRVWWGLPKRNDPETGERYSASWNLRETPYDGTTEWLPAHALPAAHFADELDTYREAA